MTLIGAVLIFGSLIVASRQLRKTSADLQRLRDEQSSLRASTVRLQNTLQKAQQQISDLRQTEASILRFLGTVTSREQIRLIDRSVDWPAVQRSLLDLPPGKRKDVALAGLLYAWKDIPFTLGGSNLSTGMDSTTFLMRVMESQCVRTHIKSGELPSHAIMSQFQRTDHPQVGDLVFYRGQVGSFGLLILVPPGSNGSGVGVGTLQRIFPLSVLRLDSINVESFPMIGYFHVPYESADCAGPNGAQ